MAPRTHEPTTRPTTQPHTRRFADYDGTPSFDGWAQFGGWGTPTLKQFSDQGSKCGCNYDISWGPNLPE
jgi:hypothetical protein